MDGAPRNNAKQILYIDGDSWLMVQNVLQFLDENYGTFKDFIIVNASVMANSNYDIVTRTIPTYEHPGVRTGACGNN